MGGDFNLSSLKSSFSLKGNENFISISNLISLYENFVCFGYREHVYLGYCREINLSDDPSLVIYSVELEKKFRCLKLSDLDFIHSRVRDELIGFFKDNSQ